MSVNDNFWVFVANLSIRPMFLRKLWPIAYGAQISQRRHQHPKLMTNMIVAMMITANKIRTIRVGGRLFAYKVAVWVRMICPTCVQSCFVEENAELRPLI